MKLNYNKWNWTNIVSIYTFIFKDAIKQQRQRLQLLIKSNIRRMTLWKKWEEILLT